MQHAAIWESVRCFELLGHLASLEVEQFGPMISTTAGQLVTALWAAPSVTEADLFPLLADTIGLAGRIGIADFTLPTNRWRFTSLRETPACIALSRQDDQLRIELSPLLLPALEAFGLS